VGGGESRRGEGALSGVAEGAAQERGGVFRRRLDGGDGSGVEDLVAQAGQVDHVVEEGDGFELVAAEDGVVGVDGDGG
jgi:hypothetical protein